MRSTPSTSKKGAAIALLSVAAATSMTSTGETGSINFVSAFIPNSNSVRFFSTESTNAGPSNAASSASSSSRLQISSFGVGDGPPSRQKKKEDVNPQNIQSYIIEAPESRTRMDLGSTVLVSGFADKDSPNLGSDTDQAIFDLLNDPSHEAGLDFETIVAFVPDAAFAKKRLVSRSARYSGLLNKLTFAESEAAITPTLEQLDGVTTWVARIEGPDAAANLDAIRNIVALTSQSPSITNVAFLLCDASALDMEAALNSIKSVQDASKSFTVVAVGKTDGDVPEATLPYSVSDIFSVPSAPSEMEPHYATTIPSAPVPPFSAIPADATHSREESFRLLTTCLGLECGRNQALAFTAVDNVNATSYKLVKGLREAGYTWTQELEHMIEGGVEVRGSCIVVACR